MQFLAPSYLCHTHTQTYATTSDTIQKYNLLLAKVDAKPVPSYTAW